MPMYEFRKAFELHKNGQLKKAIKAYQKILQSDPEHRDTLYYLGVAYTDDQNLTEAKTCLDKVVRLQPNRPAIHSALGNIAMLEENYAEAKKHFQAAIIGKPKHLYTLNNLGACLLKLGEFEDATECLTFAVELDPDHPDVLFNLGHVYLHRGRLNQALACFLRLLDIRPELEVYYNIGLIYLNQEKYSDAEGYFSEVLKRDPRHLDTHQNLGLNYLKQAKWDQAILHYEHAQRIDPGNTEIPFILAALTQKEIPNNPPPEHITHLFDQYAPYFDQHLTEHLNYSVPDTISNAVLEHVNPQEHSLKILDLGCGTGLCGEQLAKHAKKMIGIDLSPKMIAIAKEKPSYNECIVEDVCEFLKNTNEQFNLIIAGDVLGYIGELRELFENISNHLTDNGFFICTIESTTNTDTFELTKHVRYTHNKNYVQRVAEKNNLNLITCDNLILRKNQNEQVQGYLFVFSK